jgi:hypothetical protein
MSIAGSRILRGASIHRAAEKKSSRVPISKIVHRSSPITLESAISAHYRRRVDDQILRGWIDIRCSACPIACFGQALWLGFARRPNPERKDVLVNLSHRSKTLLIAVGVFMAMVLSLGAQSALVPQRSWSSIGWYWCEWYDNAEEGQWEYWCWNDDYGYWWRVE